MTFTFLPLFSLPYTHYSLLARCQALWRRFAERCSWEKALPKLKDPDRLPDPSTVRRWAGGLDSSQLAPSFLSQTVPRVAHWLVRGRQAVDETGPLSWITPILSEKPLVASSVRKILSPTILAWDCRRHRPTLGSRGEKALWAKTSKHSSCDCR
jgi:hypothetical protein